MLKSKLLSTCAYLMCASFVCAFFSCSQEIPNPDKEYFNPDEYRVFDYGVAEDTLYAEKLKGGAEIKNGLIGIVDSLLVIYRSKDKENVFCVYNVNQDKVIARFGNVGNAGNEVPQTPLGWQLFKSGDVVQIRVRVTKDMIKVFDLYKSIDEGRLVNMSSIKSKCAGEQYFALPKGGYIAREEIKSADPRDGEFEPSKIILKNNGQEMVIAKYPSKFNNPYSQFFMRGDLRISPDYNKAVEILPFFYHINIVDLNSGKVLGLKGKGSYSLSEYINNLKVSPEFANKGLKSYICAESVSEKYIFVLYGGQPLSDVGKGYAPHLQIFDWNGKKFTELAFNENEKVTGNIFYEKNKCLYSFFLGAPGLYKYDLSKYLK